MERLHGDYFDDELPRASAALVLVSGRVYGVRGESVGDVAQRIPDGYENSGVRIVSGADSYPILLDHYSPDSRYAVLMPDGRIIELPSGAGQVVYYSAIPLGGCHPTTRLTPAWPPDRPPRGSHRNTSPRGCPKQMTRLIGMGPTPSLMRMSPLPRLRIWDLRW